MIKFKRRKRKRYLDFNRKKNLRKIPDNILKKINNFNQEKIFVGAVIKISETDIKKGKYWYLGIYYENNKLNIPEKIIPQWKVGKFSHRNIRGYKIRRRDLPKEPVERPNYGDWDKGSHYVYIKYKRDFIFPKELAIKIEFMDKEFKKGETFFIFKFIVDDLINPAEQDFKEKLFSNLNLLQENVGTVDVYKNNATEEDFLKTIYVTWDILPPGERDKNITAIFTKFKQKNNEVKKRLEERYDLLEGLKPEAFIVGTNEFRRYFGAKFFDNFVVFENIEYGNAIYVMYENWEELSKLSRLKLLSMEDKNFERIIHDKNWKNNLRCLIIKQKRLRLTQ